jgi:hypothetical protein
MVTFFISDADHPRDQILATRQAQGGGKFSESSSASVKLVKIKESMTDLMAKPNIRIQKNKPFEYNKSIGQIET